MAHFARIEGDTVVDVIVVGNDDVLDEEGNESEAVGITFLQGLFGTDTVWKQTSYNNNIRKNYAMIGGTYDASKDAFIDKKPYDSWVLNETTCVWEAPVAEPTDNDTNPHHWDEENQQWVQFDPVSFEPL